MSERARAETEEDAPPRLGRAMAVGSVWMIAGRWMVRGIGLVSTIILARLLVPADFGLVASAMLVIGAIQVLTESGQRSAIIRMRNPTRAHYDSAWTMGLLIGLGVAAVLAALAPFMPAWFDDPRLDLIAWALALRPAIQAFENIGLVDLQRRLNFRRDIQILLYGKVAGFVIATVLAFLMRNYWALIAGTLAQAATGVVVSYIFIPYRPKLSFSKIGELWSFSFWSLMTSIGNYWAARSDQLVVAGMLGSEAMGTFTVGGELAALPTSELVNPPVRALYAAYSRVSHDTAAIREHYLTALSFIAVVACATSVGMALVARDAVALVLGPRWETAVAVVPWLALASGAMGMARSVNSALLAAGHARANAMRAFAFAGLLLPAALLGAQEGGVEGVALAHLGVTLLFVPVMFGLLVRLLGVPVRAVLAATWRPVVAATIMAVIVTLVHPHLPGKPLPRLAGDACAGAVAYGGTLVLLWLACGRPPGAEATVLKWLGRRLENGKLRSLLTPTRGSVHRATGS